MVNLVEDWQVLEDYAKTHKRGFYQTLDSTKTVEVRVSIGELGFWKKFSNKEDPLLARIIAFCKTRKYIEVSESIRDESFFK